MHGSAADHSFAFGYLIGHIDLDNAGGTCSHDFSGPDHNCGFAAAADGAVARASIPIIAPDLTGVDPVEESTNAQAFGWAPCARNRSME